MRRRMSLLAFIFICIVSVSACGNGSGRSKDETKEETERISIQEKSSLLEEPGTGDGQVIDDETTGTIPWEPFEEGDEPETMIDPMANQAPVSIDNAYNVDMSAYPNRDTVTIDAEGMELFITTTEAVTNLTITKLSFDGETYTKGEVLYTQAAFGTDRGVLFNAYIPENNACALVAYTAADGVENNYYLIMDRNIGGASLIAEADYIH